MLKSVLFFRAAEPYACVLVVIDVVWLCRSNLFVSEGVVGGGLGMALVEGHGSIARHRTSEGENK